MRLLYEIIGTFKHMGLVRRVGKRVHREMSVTPVPSNTVKKCTLICGA